MQTLECTVYWTLLENVVACRDRSDADMAAEVQEAPLCRPQAAPAQQEVTLLRRHDGLMEGRLRWGSVQAPEEDLEHRGGLSQIFIVKRQELVERR